jgi:hypothetical protein
MQGFVRFFLSTVAGAAKDSGHLDPYPVPVSLALSCKHLE